MIPHTKHSLILIVFFLLIFPAPVGVSQEAQIELVEASVTESTITGTAGVPATMMLIGISLILVAGRIRKNIGHDFPLDIMDN
ncbi:hypothetical protein HRM2_47560 [Desulforapulum autotrophicum HRM2]|uniref:Uncharacterized protein n=1 Tax=Desulforapulum autotrophicum (strain ATCC 43914 / DSM 3382 / VKM B-1955 / HRM2) TaxID=177437 RepID=C0QHE6_DESAH|nr:hypothetical protein [Desulforapulum autotrophicum]ACN17805.1 hypothetical protein HRM2_47560 [Desulforapulum autotrophicum HRM2]